MTTATAQSPDTKNRILDAAERLFADKGFDATSLRMITAAAEVNLAAVNYHFQSKEALLQAVYARRAGPGEQDESNARIANRMQGKRRGRRRRIW